ncbi:unnamed protein product, partial [Choristocarpus tenellus]
MKFEGEDRDEASCEGETGVFTSRSVASKVRDSPNSQKLTMVGAEDPTLLVIGQASDIFPRALPSVQRLKEEREGEGEGSNNMKGLSHDREGSEGNECVVEEGEKERDLQAMNVGGDVKTPPRQFVESFLDQVVTTVVKRQDLEVGIGTKGGTAAFSVGEEEQDLRMGVLLSLGVQLDRDRLTTLLRYTDWGPKHAAALYQDLVAAEKGFLEPPCPGTAIRGMENGGNTCYIDSLLFAMFARVDAFDWLLLKPLPPSDPPEV